MHFQSPWQVVGASVVFGSVLVSLHTLSPLLGELAFGAVLGCSIRHKFNKARRTNGT